MTITALSILPPLVIGRFGSSAKPLEAYSLKVRPEAPLDYREIVPEDTFEVDPDSGEISRKYKPEWITFRDGQQIRPVAPFVEVYGSIDGQDAVPLTLAILEREGLGPEDLVWTINVANIKVFRQTGDEGDKVLADATFSDHESHALQGRAAHFIQGKYIPFGTVRYIRPTQDFPEIRLRFTPPHGVVYGSSTMRSDMEEGEIVDPTFVGREERIVYDSARGRWQNFKADADSKTLPNPSDIYQGIWPSTAPLPIGWGYLDDVCDGRISVAIKRTDGTVISSSAWLSSCMPAFAPDSEPVRTVADELEQLILGPEVDDEEVSVDAAAEIVRRALETVRPMNTAAMNANVIRGRVNVASTLFRQDANDYGRMWAPGMAPSIVDNLSLRTLHERIYAALKSGSAPWFAEVLRRPEEVGDLTDKARRKMPAMLRGADGRALTLSRRQISQIVKAAALQALAMKSDDANGGAQ